MGGGTQDGPPCRRPHGKRHVLCLMDRNSGGIIWGVFRWRRFQNPPNSLWQSGRKGISSRPAGEWHHNLIPVKPLRRKNPTRGSPEMTHKPFHITTVLFDPEGPLAAVADGRWVPRATAKRMVAMLRARGFGMGIAGRHAKKAGLDFMNQAFQMRPADIRPCLSLGSTRSDGRRRNPFQRPPKACERLRSGSWWYPPTAMCSRWQKRPGPLPSSGARTGRRMRRADDRLSRPATSPTHPADPHGRSAAGRQTPQRPPAGVSRSEFRFEDPRS